MSACERYFEGEKKNNVKHVTADAVWVLVSVAGGLQVRRAAKEKWVRLVVLTV